MALEVRKWPFLVKNFKFWPKMAIFSGPKIFRKIFFSFFLLFRPFLIVLNESKKNWTPFGPFLAPVWPLFDRGEMRKNVRVRKIFQCTQALPSVHRCARTNIRTRLRKLAPLSLSGPTRLIECQWCRHRRSRGCRFAHLVSLNVYIDLEGRMIPQSDTLDKANRPNHVLKFLDH